MSHRNSTAAMSVTLWSAGAATVVALATTGHATAALLLVTAVYVIRTIDTVKLALWLLRTCAWAAVAGALLAVSHGATGPGGAPLGLSLAVALAVALVKIRRVIPRRTR